MPTKPAPGAKVEPENQRQQVFFGTLTKKRKDSSGATVNTPRAYIASCRKSVQDLLNLPIPTDAQLEYVSNGREITLGGARNGKTIRVPHPTGAKTPKGAIQTLSIQVPTNATVKEIRAFLKSGGKAEKFTIQGGRSYSVPK